MLISENISNANLLYVFLYIIDWINFDLIMNFWNQDCGAPKGHWCEEHKWQLFSHFVVLMTSLDHSLVHVRNKQEKIFIV